MIVSLAAHGPSYCLLRIAVNFGDCSTGIQSRVAASRERALVSYVSPLLYLCQAFVRLPVRKRKKRQNEKRQNERRPPGRTDTRITTSVRNSLLLLQPPPNATRRNSTDAKLA